MDENLHPTVLERILAIFVDTWIEYVFLLPENHHRDSFRIETIQKLEELIAILHDLQYENHFLTNYDELREFEEKTDD